MSLLSMFPHNPVSHTDISNLFIVHCIIKQFFIIFSLVFMTPINIHIGALSLVNLTNSNNFINLFETGDVYVRQLFHCLQLYAGSERVNSKLKSSV